MKIEISRKIVTKTPESNDSDVSENYKLIKLCKWNRIINFPDLRDSLIFKANSIDETERTRG